MTDQPSELRGQTLLVFGCAVLLIAVCAQFLIVFHNVGFVTHNFGWPALVAYSAAALGLVVIPAYAAHFGKNLHLRLTQLTATAFCSWITFEENLHAAEHWTPPAGAKALAEAVLAPEQAKQAALLALVIVMFLTVELLAHFTHHGFHLVTEGRKQIRSKPTRTRRKA